MMGDKFSDTLIGKIKSNAGKRYSITELAEKAGCSVTAAAIICKQEGIETKQWCKPLTDSQKKAINQLASHNLSAKQIAYQIKASVHYTRKYLIENNLPMKKGMVKEKESTKIFDWKDFENRIF